MLECLLMVRMIMINVSFNLNVVVVVDDHPNDLNLKYILKINLLVVYDDDPEDDFNEYIQHKHTNRGRLGLSPKDKRLIDNHLHSFPSC